MADSPFTSKASEKRTSLQEMAARAAQRTSRPPPSVPPSSRNAAPRAAGSFPPPSPSYAPSPSSYAPSDFEGSGLINLSHISQVPTLAPQVRAIQPPHATPATPVGAQVPVQAAPSYGSRPVLAGVVVALVGIGVAFGLTSRNGSDAPAPRAAAVAEPVQPAAAIAPVAPAAVAPAAVAPATVAPAQPVAAAPAAPVAAAEKVNPPPGTIAPADATEVTRPATHATGKVKGKGKKGAAVAAAPAAAAPAAAAPAAETTPAPGAGAAAIAAAMAAEGVPPAAPQAKAAEPAAPPPAKAAPAAPPAPEPTGLAGAIKKAVGPTEPAPPPEKAEAKAPPPRGDIPELPAQGAIQGALGSPRAAARNCLAGQEAPSRATIVFASSGNVQTVTVTGPAAGTPAAECIKTAMSKTVVGPFKHASFSVSTTISPP
jgi:hypothetical protein